MALKKREDSLLSREDFDGGPVSLDLIDTGVYLGNITAATCLETLKQHNITHILTLDSVPLPSFILETQFLTTKFIHISDLPKEDILQSLEICVDFIKSTLKDNKIVLVHCYFGVSRSSSAVLAYIMVKYNMEYEQAFEFVKSKRKYVQPNSGFVYQLKLFRRMGCKIDHNYLKYKIYRLRIAAFNVAKVKILPQMFIDVIKSDPALIQENPEPIVYRCKKCRRIVASHSNALPHKVRNAKEECKYLIFLEPILWMKDVLNRTQGRLNCPKCSQKLGSFSWINGCQCPCGREISPAFYMVPSKVELSKAVQNVQTTI